MATELTEWRPFSDFAELRHRLDKAFRDLSDARPRRALRNGRSRSSPNPSSWMARSMAARG